MHFLLSWDILIINFKFFYNFYNFEVGVDKVSGLVSLYFQHKDLCCSFLLAVECRLFCFRLFLWFMFSIYGWEDIYDDLPRHKMVISDNSTTDITMKRVCTLYMNHKIRLVPINALSRFGKFVRSIMQIFLPSSAIIAAKTQLRIARPSGFIFSTSTSTHPPGFLRHSFYAKVEFPCICSLISCINIY